MIESLLGRPTVSTTTSSNTSGGDGKGSGAREWIKNKLKALSQLLGKLADKTLAALPGVIGSILSWILNRAKEVAISEFVGAHNRCWSLDVHIFHDKDKEEISVVSTLVLFVTLR